ncbi:hypothetical protein AX17_005929 [Amanita inopinata Kibby_2008]|nr:hypothetical protein AX17_005929 [Amanita inopinata Kibby_2008]
MSTFYFYEPFSDFDRLFNEAFDARFRPLGQPSSGTTVQRRAGETGEVGRPHRPRMDLHENVENNTVTATFELPGLTKENVHIDVHNGRLSISGESKTSAEHEEGGYAVRERRYGKFSRTLQLPQGDEQIRAAMGDGVLTVTFPKSTPEAAPKKITIS